MPTGDAGAVDGAGRSRGTASSTKARRLPTATGLADAAAAEADGWADGIGTHVDEPEQQRARDEHAGQQAGKDRQPGPHAGGGYQYGRPGAGLCRRC